VIVEITRIFRVHLGQSRTLTPKDRFILTAESRRLDQAKSWPSSRRPQGATEIIVGSTSTTGSAATPATVSAASVSAGAGEAASLGAGAGASGAAAGDGTASDAVAGDPAVGDAGAGDCAAGADGDGAAAHGFGFAPGGGFGVTGERHDDRDANTPW
jgi:hypothetical protein